MANFVFRLRKASDANDKKEKRSEVTTDKFYPVYYVIKVNVTPKIISLTLLIAKVSPRKKVVLGGEIRDLSKTLHLLSLH